MCKSKLTHHSSFKVFILFLSLISTHAFAETVLNGISIHSQLGQERFIAGLSVSNLSTNPNEILIANENKRIQLRILSDRISARSFKRMWIEGMAINSSSAELTEHAQQMADFSNLLKIKLIAGDIFTVDRTDDAVRVILNGITLGEISDTAFFDLLLRTWIGPVPLSSGFRNNLLVGGEIDNALLSRFDNTFPSDERIASVQKNVQNLAKRETRTVAAAAPAVETIPQTAIAAPPAITAPSPVVPDIPSPIAQAPAPQEEEEKEEEQEQPQQEALLDPGFIDEEDEEDLDFTAESLLAQQLYIASLKKWSYKFLSYPKRALDRSWEGNVRLSITIDRLGKVNNIEVTEAASHSTLTKAAVKAANKASPFPPMPNELSGEDFTFTLPVVFQLRN